jgi:hypothetical protein
MALPWISMLVLIGLAIAEDGTTVYKFDAIISDDNLLTIQPRKNPAQSMGYSICLRAMFWKNDEILLFQSTNISLIVFNGKFVCISINSTKHCFDWITNSGVSMQWKSICIIHSFMDFTVNTSINGKLVNSMKIIVTTNFTENLSNPIEMGGGKLSLKYITDFNIWNRPLSVQEVEEYLRGLNFNTLTGMNGPEILGWSNVNATYQGYYCNKFVISRSLLASQIQISSEEPPIKPFFILNNPLSKSYDNSKRFCKQIRGTVFLPTQSNLNFARSYYYWDFLIRDLFWVPIIKSTDSNSKWVYDNEVEDHSESIPIINIKGSNDENCLAFNLSSEGYIPQECSKEQHLFCKIPEEGTMFYAFQNSSINVELESNYILTNDENFLYYAGINGKNSIFYNSTMWIIYDVNSMTTIGFYTEKNLESPAGLRSVTILDNGKNGDIKIQMKLSNVSKVCVNFFFIFHYYFIENKHAFLRCFSSYLIYCNKCCQVQKLIFIINNNYMFK